MALNIAETYKKMFLALAPANLKKFSKEKKDSASDGAKVYALAWAAAFAISLLILAYNVVGTGMDAALSAQLGFEVGGSAALAAFLIISLTGLAWGIASVFVSQHAGKYVAASFFGGKGTFESQFYLNMLFSGAVMVCTSALTLVAVLLPPLDLLAGLASVLLVLYWLYLLYSAMGSVHKIGAPGAVVSAMAILLVQVVSFFVISVIIASVMLALGLGPTLPPVE